jgi:hypothetical protein
MKLSTGWSYDSHSAAVTGLYERVAARLDAPPDLLFVFCSTDCAAEEVVKTLHEHVPLAALHGGTSCLGVMTAEGVHTAGGRGLGVLALCDENGRFGTGAAVIGAEDPAAAARQATLQALHKAGCPGEVPALICMTAAPGCEEVLIAGIKAVVGEVPIIGGSAADNETAGARKQFANDRVYAGAVVVTVLFPSTEILFSSHTGYEPTLDRGTVTRMEGRRLLLEIDGRSAAAVYNEWTRAGADCSAGGSNAVLSWGALHPLGQEIGRVGDMPCFRLMLPDVDPDRGALRLFADVDTGDEVILMQGDTDSLVARVGRVAASALEIYSLSPPDIAGALVFFCSGCMLRVGDRIKEIAAGLRRSLPEIPFLGAFTCGEQGVFPDGENHHGNLMITVILFTGNRES